MEPFAATPKRAVPLHWWIVIGVGGAFFIWAFDLIPRLRDVASGRIATATGDAKTFAAELDHLPDFGDESFAEGTEPELLDADTSASDSEDRVDPDAAAVVSSELSFSEPDGQITQVSATRSDSESATALDVQRADAELLSDAALMPDDTDSTEQVLPAEVAEKLRTADASIRADRILDAHAVLSAIYWKHPECRTLIAERIDSTATQIFTSSERHFAKPHFVEYGETLGSIADDYAVPWQYLAMLNRVTPQTLQAGQQLKVVRGPFAAVVDLSDFSLTVHAHGWYVHRYRIGIGKDERTPTGQFTVQNKLENPTWYSPDGEVVDADDPENPLGEYWLGLGDHIGIHGTIDPSTIGRAASRGCVHLADEDISEVFALLSVGSTVLIRK